METEKIKCYLGVIASATKVDRIVYDNYKDLMLNQINTFVDYCKTNYADFLDVQEQTREEIAETIIKKVQEWVETDNEITLCDEFLNIIDPYAEENENKEFVMADGTNIDDFSIDFIVEEMKKYIDNIINFIYEKENKK